MKVSIQTWITHRPQMSPIVYDRLLSTTEFKADMHSLYLQAQKDPKRTWVKLLFISIDDAICKELAAWPPEWCALDMAALERMASQ